MKKEFYNIAKLVTKNAKILDVGCGNGELMKYITENISKDIIVIQDYFKFRYILNILFRY